MEKLRFKQAQMLINEAGKSKQCKETLKPPQEAKINADLFANILNNIIDAEDFIYQSRPTHILGEDDAQLFCNQILEVKSQLEDILRDFGVMDKLNVEDEIKSLSEKFLILTTKSSFKKALTRLAVDPQRVIVAGVPLKVEDMKEINPHLPESALEPIKKKIEHVKSDVRRKKDQFGISDVLVLVEKDKSGQILAKRAEEIYHAKSVSVENLKDISDVELLNLLLKLS